MRVLPIAVLAIVSAVFLFCDIAKAESLHRDPSYQNASLSSSFNRGTITGPTRGLDRTLLRRLDRMSAHFGKPVHLTPHGGCRAHGSRSAPRSQHRIAIGCKAADIWIEGVKKTTVLRYWRANGGGGRGYYCRRDFVHVDTGPSRSWAWFCGRKRGRYLI